MKESRKLSCSKFLVWGLTNFGETDNFYVWTNFYDFYYFSKNLSIFLLEHLFPVFVRRNIFLIWKEDLVQNIGDPHSAKTRLGQYPTTYNHTELSEGMISSCKTMHKWIFSYNALIGQTSFCLLLQTIKNYTFLAKKSEERPAVLRNLSIYYGKNV